MVSSFRLYVTLVTSGSKRMTVKSLTKQELYDSGFSDEDIVLMRYCIDATYENGWRQ